jgi:hypothetical protein
LIQGLIRLNSKKGVVMKSLSLSNRSFFLLLTVLLATPLSSLANVSETEPRHLADDKEEAYLYCGKDRSILPDFIEAVAHIDTDKNSPVWRLHDHLDRGLIIGRVDTILEALEYAERTLDQRYRELRHEQAEMLYANLYVVMNEIEKGALHIDIQSLSEEQRRSCCNDTPPCNKTIKVREKLYVLNRAKFFDTVEFKQNVEIEGTLSVADQVIDCDLTVGCNINMNNSTSGAVGNIIKGEASFMSNFGIQNTFLGIEAGNFVMTGDSNTGLGFNALNVNTAGIGNTAVGSRALETNLVGEANTAVGANALLSNLADENTAVGFAALQGNATGTANVAVGVGALNSNITGSSNTAVGWNALAVSTDSENVAVGAFALNQNLGIENAAVGVNAAQQTTTGSFNSVLGNDALLANTTGTGNTAVGFGALPISSGSNNSALGANAGLLLATGDNNVYVANPGIAAESGAIRIGTSGLHAAAFMQGIFGAAVAIGGLPVEVDAVGKLGTVVSSAAFKKDIRDMDSASEKIHVLRPVKFAYRSDKTNTEQYGLIAEEVANVFPELVVYDLEGQPYSVRYQVLPVLLLNEVQKQQVRMDALAERVAHLEATAA